MSAAAVPRSKPRAVLVDIDNTLYAYEPCHRAGMDAAASAAAELADRWRSAEQFLRDFQAARTEVKRRLGRCAAAHSRLLYFKEMVDSCPGQADLEAATRLETAYWTAYGRRMSVEPGACELLEQLRRSGVRLAWVSNYTTARQIWKLRQLEMHRCGAALVTSEEAGSEKPDPAIVDLALARLGRTSEETWLVGDSLEEDIAVARARNIFPILLTRGAGGGSDNRYFSASSWQEIRGLFET